MYQTEQGTHSVTVLKKKFDEIKRSIQNIEQKQKEFFTTSHSLNHSFMGDRPAPPVTDALNTSTLSLQRREYESEGGRHYQSTLQRLERENSELANQVLELSTQNSKLMRENQESKEKITALELELKRLNSVQRPDYTYSRLTPDATNSALSSRLSYPKPVSTTPIQRGEYTPRNYATYDTDRNMPFSMTSTSVPSKSRPSSIIRNAKSPPKHNRVAFKTDLVEVNHIDNEEPAATRSQVYLEKRAEEQVRGKTSASLYRKEEDILAASKSQSSFYRREEDPGKLTLYRREEPPKDYQRWTRYYNRASFE